VRIAQDVDLQQPGAGRSESGTNHQVEDRGGQRQALQYRAGDRHDHQKPADGQVAVNEPHGLL